MQDKSVQAPSPVRGTPPAYAVFVKAGYSFLIGPTGQAVVLARAMGPQCEVPFDRYALDILVNPQAWTEVAVIRDGVRSSTNVGEMLFPKLLRRLESVRLSIGNSMRLVVD